MKKQLNEVKRMQVLAGLITENQDQVMGYIFDNPEEWNDENVISTIKDMGYDDAEEITKEITTTTSPEDFLNNMRSKMENDNLQFSDLTLDMFKQSIEDDFEKELDESVVPGEVGDALDYLSTLSPAALSAAIAGMGGAAVGFIAMLKAAIKNTDTMSGLNR
jgi:hypothetical protein